MKKQMNRALTYLSASIIAIYSGSFAADQADPDCVVSRNPLAAGVAAMSMTKAAMAPLALPIDGANGMTIVHSVKRIGTTNYTKSWTYTGPLVTDIVVSTIDTGALTSSGQIQRSDTGEYLGWYTIKKNYMGQPVYHYNNNTKTPDSIVIGNFSMTDISASVTPRTYPTLGWLATGFGAGKNGNSTMGYYCAKAPAPYNFNNMILPQISGVVAVDVDEKGAPWAVLSNGDIYTLQVAGSLTSWKRQYKGSAAIKPVDVGVGSGKVYFCGLNTTNQNYTLYELTGINTAQVVKTTLGETINAKRVDVTAYQFQLGTCDVWYVSAKPANDGELYLFDTTFPLLMDDTTTGKTIDVGAVADFLQ